LPEKRAIINIHEKKGYCQFQSLNRDIELPEAEQALYYRMEVLSALVHT